MGSSWWCQTYGAGEASLWWEGLVLEISWDSDGQRGAECVQIIFRIAMLVGGTETTVAAEVAAEGRVQAIVDSPRAPVKSGPPPNCK